MFIKQSTQILKRQLEEAFPTIQPRKETMTIDEYLTYKNNPIHPPSPLDNTTIVIAAYCPSDDRNVTSHILLQNFTDLTIDLSSIRRIMATIYRDGSIEYFLQIPSWKHTLDMDLTNDETDRIDNENLSDYWDTDFFMDNTPPNKPFDFETEIQTIAKRLNDKAGHFINTFERECHIVAKPFHESPLGLSSYKRDHEYNLKLKQILSSTKSNDEAYGQIVRLNIRYKEQFPLC